jgi:hypothetical protein
LTLSAAGGRLAVRIEGLAALDAAVRHALAVFADPHLSLPLAGAAATLLGTYLLVLLTLGLTGDPRH